MSSLKAITITVHHKRVNYTVAVCSFFVVVDVGFTTLLTSQVIRIAFHSEREQSDKFCLEALILA